MKPYYQDDAVTLYHGDCRDVLGQLGPESVQTVVTSPPYWGLRDYGLGDDSLGLEPTPELYVEHMVEIFREVKRVLRDDGTIWLNLGDSYYNHRPGGTSQTKQSLAKHNGAIVEHTAKRNNRIDGLKEKDLIGIPWRVAFGLQADGWILRSDIIWAKPNPMPESVRDRPTKSHEYIFLLSKKPRYYYDGDAIREPHIEPWRSNGKAEKNNWSVMEHRGSHDTIREYNPLGRNKRTVWTVATQPTPEAHFATFPEKLIEPCILAGAPSGGVVMDIFSGTGTTLRVAKRLGRRAVGIEASEGYCTMIGDEIRQMVMQL